MRKIIRKIQLGYVEYGKIFVFGERMYVKVKAPYLNGSDFVPCVPIGTINSNAIQYFHYSSLVEV